jgi:hypothetical protein
MTPASTPSKPRTKSKALATWAAFLGGALGLHRFYLYGRHDVLGWLLPVPSLMGLWGMHRAFVYGQDDQLAWLLVPVLGFTLAGTMLQGIVYGLTPDATWHAHHNPHLSGDRAPISGWPVVFGIVLSLMVGATVLMATIAFSGQRYFEYQVEEARKISQ